MYIVPCQTGLGRFALRFVLVSLCLSGVNRSASDTWISGVAVSCRRVITDAAGG